MKQFMAICSRNIKIYLRDKGSLVFSFLSMLIVIGLMLLFLGDTTVNGVMGIFENIPGRGGAADLEMSKNLIFLWTTAGILAINGATITLAFYANMIKDRNGNRLNSIMVMPINRTIIVAGYIFSAWLVSVVMNLLTLAIVEAIGLAKGIELFSLAAHIELLAIIMVNSLVYASIMYFFASLIKTEGAWSGFGIIVGTLVGFLGGIYFPLGSISEGVAKIVKAFPVIYGTSVFRIIMMNDLEGKLFSDLPSEVREIFDTEMGLNIKVFENILSIGQEVVILLAVSLIFALLSLLYLRYSKKTDR